MLHSTSQRMLKKKFVKFFEANQLGIYFDRVNIWTDGLVKSATTATGAYRNYEYIEKVLKTSFRIRHYYTDIFYDLFFDAKTGSKNWGHLAEDIRKYVDARLAETSKFDTFVPRSEQQGWFEYE